MTAQTQLVKVAPTAAGLTPDQQTAWNLVRSTPGGCFAEEVGRAVHVSNGRHDGEGYCEWCLDRGQSVLKSKRLRALVIYRRVAKKYEPKNPADRAREPMGDIPW